MKKSVQICNSEGLSVMAFYPQEGGIMDSLVLQKPNGEWVNVLTPIEDATDLAQNTSFKNIPLFPFPNRLADGKYHWQGNAFQFPVNEIERNNNLHGFSFNQAFELQNSLTQAGEVKTSLVLVYNGEFGHYPYASRMTLDFCITDSSTLIVDMDVVNNSENTMPIGMGWHPYFSLGGESVSDLTLHLPEVEQIEMDERAIPTGARFAFDTFSSPTTIGDVVLDDCFAVKEAGRTAKTRLWSEKQQYGIEVWQECGPEAFGYLQVFTHPKRERIAIEPMTCNVNAFQNEQGLKALQPGERFRAKFGVRLISSLDEA